MIYGSWRQRLARSLHTSRSKPHARFVQLASVDVNGKVQNRTLVYRGFIDDSDALIMVTDRRSDKYEAIKNNQQVELCWYFDKSREQYRINGLINIIDVQNAQLSQTNQVTREQVWKTLSASAQAQFYWYLNEGKDNNLPEQITAPELIPDTFCVMLLLPTEIDYLLLADPQQRFINKKTNGKWQELPIKP